MGITRGGPQEIPRPPEVHEGGPPSWSELDVDRLDISLERVRTVFASRDIGAATAVAPAARARSAVAVIVSGGPLPDERSGAPSCELLLTRRAWHLRTHRGEVAFPGGIEEVGDHYPEGTALREAREEVGLDSAVIEVVGALDALTTFAGGASILPVVAVTTSRPDVVAAPSEVDDVLHVPLVDLLHPDCYRQELWSWAGDGNIPSIHRHPMHFFEIPGDTIWGATAAMVYQFLTLIVGDDR